jgi:hypothetical protein
MVVIASVIIFSGCVFIDNAPKTDSSTQHSPTPSTTVKALAATAAPVPPIKKATEVEEDDFGVTEPVTDTAEAQELPGNFVFKRETGQETGVPLFMLMTDDNAVAYDAEHGNTFEAVGMLVQPERDKYGIIFINAKREYQLQEPEDKGKGALLRIEGEEFKIPEYLITASKEIGRLKIEIAGVTINKNIYEKMVRASDIFISVGSAKYNLDQDNIDALHYLGAEVKKDLARRRKQL